MLRPRGAVLQLARRPGARRVGSAHSRRAIGLVPFGHAARAWNCPAACAEARRTKGGQCPLPARDWAGSLRSCCARVELSCSLRGGPAREGRAGLAGVTAHEGCAATHSMRGSSYPSRLSPCHLPLRGRVGSAHSRRAIELVPFGNAVPAWSCPAACAEARLAKGEPGLRGSRRTKGAPRRTACAAPPIRHGFRRATFPSGEGFFCAPSASVERGGVLLRRPTEAAQAMRRVWQDAAFPPGCIGNDRRAANTTGHQK